MAAALAAVAPVAAMSARPDLPIQATHPPRHCLVSLGRLQRAQAVGPYQDHLVIASATGLMNPGHPRPPGTIALMPFPGEQMPGHATRQLDQRRRPWRRVPRHKPSMRSYVRLMCLDRAICVHLLAVSRPCDPLLAKEVAVPAGPAAAQARSAAGCSVTDRESPWVTLLTGTWRACSVSWMFPTRRPAGPRDRPRAVARSGAVVRDRVGWPGRSRCGRSRGRGGRCRGCARRWWVWPVSAGQTGGRCRRPGRGWGHTPRR
jgi:hypothetical protein